jgi:putative membrane protein
VRSFDDHEHGAQSRRRGACQVGAIRSQRVQAGELEVIANAVIVFVAIEHIGFLILEMFLWTKPIGRRVFGLSAEFAESSKVLAANQGLYNGFLAAGLIWSLFAGAQAKVFFLACVIVAGIFGAITVKRTALWIQGAPAMIALLLVFMT